MINKIYIELYQIIEILLKISLYIRYVKFTKLQPDITKPLDLLIQNFLKSS